MLTTPHYKESVCFMENNQIVINNLREELRVKSMDYDAEHKAHIKMSAAYMELSDKYELLLDEFGVSAKFPPCLGLTPSQIRILGVLLVRTMVTHSQFYTVLYEGRDVDITGNTLKVFISHMRKKLAPYGIKINTIWGQGFCMTEGSKDLLRALMAKDGIKS